MIPSPAKNEINYAYEGLRASVIVPAYNAERFLPRCLAALHAQTLPATDYEIVVVDDGSSDNTAQLAKEGGVRVVRGEHAGAAAARNAGVAAALAPIVVFTDADCEPAPDFLQHLLTPLDHPKVSGARGVYRSRQKGIVARFVQLEYEERYSRIAHIAEEQGTVNALDTSYCCYRRDDFLAAGGFDTRFASAAGEDHELSYRMAEAGHVFRFVPEAVVYHWHMDSVWDYARRKFRIGYWKAFLARQHPGYLLKDSHMTQSLKIQIALAGLLWLSLFLWIFWPPAGWLVLVLAMLFVVSAVPFLLLARRHDPPVMVVALPLLLVRATAAGLGFCWGLVHR
ncbi:MAG: glycosyltransferase [Chloroflexi bacterium]|nr:glycosyltransferase [Chloroflexota bacterium]